MKILKKKIPLFRVACNMQRVTHNIGVAFGTFSGTRARLRSGPKPYRCGSNACGAIGWNGLTLANYAEIRLPMISEWHTVFCGFSCYIVPIYFSRCDFRF